MRFPRQGFVKRKKKVSTKKPLIPNNKRSLKMQKQKHKGPIPINKRGSYSLKSSSSPKYQKNKQSLFVNSRRYAKK
jgi:hypothetical protein